MQPADPQLIAYALGTIGIRPLPGTATANAAQMGEETAQMIDELTLLKERLLAVDASRPELGIAKELLRLGDLLAGGDSEGFVNGLRALTDTATPYFAA